MRFARKAVEKIHRLSGGIPRLVNLICDRALLAGFAQQTDTISAEMVIDAAEGLDVQKPSSSSTRPAWRWIARRAQLLAAAAVVLLACAVTVGVSAFMYERFGMAAMRAETRSLPSASASRGNTAALAADRVLPENTPFTILVGAYPLDDRNAAADVRSTTEWLEGAGLHVYYAPIDSASGGRWQRVLAGAYADEASARADADKLKASIPSLDPQVVAARVAAAPSGDTGDGTDIRMRRAGLSP